MPSERPLSLPSKIGPWLSLARECVAIVVPVATALWFVTLAVVIAKQQLDIDVIADVRRWMADRKQHKITDAELERMWKGDSDDTGSVD